MKEKPGQPAEPVRGEAMKIINMIPILAFGDAVGNDALAVHQCLKEAGFNSLVAADYIDERLGTDIAVRTDDLSFIEPDDLVIYHLSTGNKLNSRFGALPCRKIVKYHNITPPDFFFGYEKETVKACIAGYKEAAALSDKPVFAFADSAYNKSELIRLGYQCEIEVLPILIPFEDYEKEPDAEVMERMNDGCTNIIFTGRVVPNKKQEDIIAAFYTYQKYYNPDSRLILVGNHALIPAYYESLEEYVKALGVRNVIFTGHIKFSAILAYYKSADLFLCMSDHEGFCVPLLEAMFFDVPIVAKDTTAVGETLGGSGILLPDAGPGMAAGVMNRVLTDEALRKKVLDNQKERLKDFDNGRIKKQLLKRIGSLMGRQEAER